MARGKCLQYPCRNAPGPTGWCDRHAASPTALAQWRWAADPAAAQVAAAAQDRQTHGVLAVRPLSLVVACPGCGQRHALPVGALDRSVQMRCGSWLKPALTVTGA